MSVAKEATWKRISDRKYQRLDAEGEWKTIDMPYGKVELIFNEFIGEGGIIDPDTGMVKTDLGTLMSKFGVIGNIILTEFDGQGEVSVKGNTKNLSYKEVPPLFEIAVDVIESFTAAITVMEKLSMASQPVSEEKVKSKKTKE